MIIGENEEQAVNEEICGAVMSARNRVDRIALWTKSKDKQNVTINVG